MTSATLTFEGEASTATLPADVPTSTIGAPRVMPSLERRLRRIRGHRIRAAALDSAIIAGAASATAALQSLVSSTGAAEIVIGGALLVATWVTALVLIERARRRQSGSSTTSLMPLLHSALIGIAVLAIVAGLAGWPILRLHVLATLPGALLALVSVRLIRRAFPRIAVDLAPRTIVIGRRGDIENTIRTLVRDDRTRHNVIGAVLSDGTAGGLRIDGVLYPALGSSADVVAIARELCIETVVAASVTDEPDFVRRLSWSLEGAATNVVFATHLTDVAPTRISFGRTAGLALTRVNLPRFDQTAMRSKRLLDVVVSTLALIPIGVVTPIIALLIALESPGGVFFRQRRIGRDGHEFEILKFRTMRASAEEELAGLATQNEGSGPLFKLRQDPRVTRVGGILRRFSLDEIPQFWNVLRGEMSVVGPRPPLPAEVRDYESTVLRRLYVQPGITGLWQISGRSDLSWEQSVRLDLHYVENWSVATDLRIMCRTAAVMVRPKGAY